MQTTLYFSLTAESGRSVEALGRCLGMAIRWMRASQLKFNPSKSELLSTKALRGLRRSLVLKVVALHQQVHSWGGGVLLDPRLQSEAQDSSISFD